MSDMKTLIPAALLIAAAFALGEAARPAAAFNGGPYQLMHHSNTAANAGVFRLDTNTGEVSYCFVVGTTGVDISCTKPVR